MPLILPRRYSSDRLTENSGEIDKAMQILDDGVVKLKHIGDCEKHGMLYRNFDIMLSDSETVIGECNLRSGDAEFESYAGNAGYAIDEQYRGHRYSLNAVMLLARLATELGFDKLILCCAESNRASSRICELSGAVLVGKVKIPPDSVLYSYGRKEALKYELPLPCRKLK